MKNRASLRSLLLLAAAAQLGVSIVHAADTDGTWTKNATGTQNWNDPLNWSGGNVADGIGFSAFLSNVITADRTITLDTARTIGNIYAQDTTHNFTISGANTLTLDASSGQSILSVVSGRTLNLGTALTVHDGIDKQGAGNLNITGAIELGGSQTWTNNSTGSFNYANLNLGTGTLTFSGSGNFNQASSTIANTAGSIIHGGSGVVMLGRATGALAYTGTTTISGGGTLMIDDSKPSGNFILTNGILTDYYQTTHAFTSGLGTGSNQIQITGNSGFGAGNSTSTWRIGGSGSTLVWGALGEGTATGHFNPTTLRLRSAQGDNNGGGNIWGQPALDNRLDLNSGSRTINVYLGGGNIGNSRATIDDGIQDTGGTGSLTKTGGGMLIINGTNSTWGGNTNVNSGILFLGGNSENSIGGGSARNITIAAGAGIQFNALSNAVLNRIVETADEIAVMTGTSSNNLDFLNTATGANLPNAFLGNWANNGSKAEISGTITPGSNGYKLGATGSNGLLGIVGTNKLTGANTLTVGQIGASGIRVNIAAAQDFTGTTVINTGGRLTLGNNLALQNSALNVGSAGGNFSLAAGTNGGKITGESAAPSPTFGGLIGSRNLIAVFSNATGNNETNLAASAVTGFTLNVGTDSTHTYSGSIGGFGTGAVSNAGGNSSLTKIGEGTQILSGIHTYTGTTTINGGILDLGTTGSIVSSTALVLGPAGTLKTSDQTANYGIPASQPITFGIDSTGTGSSGKIVADELDISNATVIFDIPLALDDAVYVLATYTPGSLTGTFLSAPASPAGYTLDYAYEGNKIALVSTGGAPEIAIEEPVNTDILNTGSRDFGTVTLGSVTTKTFTIRNTGTSSLSLTGTPDLVAVSGANASEFTITAVPNNTVAASSTTTFTVQFAPTAAGVRNATLTITNTDSDEGTFTISVSGTGQTKYQAWAGGTAFDADANGDGVSNGLAFLLGASTPFSTVTLPTPVENNGDLVLTFPCLTDANRGGAQLFVQHSSDVGVSDTWASSAAVSNTPGAPVNGVTLSVSSGSPTNTVTATIDDSQAVDGSLFGRLKAENP